MQNSQINNSISPNKKNMNNNTKSIMQSSAGKRGFGHSPVKLNR